MDGQRENITFVIEGTQKLTSFFKTFSYRSANRDGSNESVCRYQIRTHADNTITVETTQKSRASFP